MLSLIFNDQNNTVNVTYITDMLSVSNHNFTVMDIKNLSNNNVKLDGMLFQRMSYTLEQFKAFATAHHLRLTVFDNQGKVPTIILVDYNPYYNGGLGEDNI